MNYPLLLIYLRLGLGILLLSSITCFHWLTGAWFVLIMITGLLSDVFDGIIARRMNISTTSLRKLDSNVDQFFWLCILISAIYLNTIFFKQQALTIICLVSLEIATYIYCYVKFKQEVAFHSWGSKLWTLTMCMFFIEVTCFKGNSLFFYICFFVGVLSRLENMLIIHYLPAWQNDVPSAYHAYLIKKGKPIKKHTLLNG